MHARNRYRDGPNFHDMRELIPYSDESGRVDWSNPAAMRKVSATLMKLHFGLTVTLREDRLCPGIPGRLNYIHWVEDLLGSPSAAARGLDIGTGASCVYALLGAALHRSTSSKWTFLCTEVDRESFRTAQINVSDNKLEDVIDVRLVDKSTILDGVITHDDGTFDFCMCNPRT